MLNVAGDVKELVEVKAHASFDKYAKDAGSNAQGPHKALLAPKGQYWDTPADKVQTHTHTQKCIVRRERPGSGSSGGRRGGRATIRQTSSVAVDRMMGVCAHYRAACVN